MTLKYVMVDRGFPIIFSGAMSHRSFKGMNHSFLDGIVTSAGFVKVSPEGDKVSATVYGLSDSLNVSSNPKDSAIITALFNAEY